MAAIITDDFRKNNIERFFDDVFKTKAQGGTDYYLGIGKTDPYEDDESNNAETNDSAFTPPTPTGSIVDKEDIKKNLMTLKLVEQNDIKRLIPQVPFSIGIKYKVYNPFDPTCFDITDDVQPCYAVYTGADGKARIYMCLGNNNGGKTSEVIPETAAGANFPYGVQQNTTDKYIWAYVCNFDKHRPANKFSSSKTFMNLPVDSNIDTELSDEVAGFSDGRKRATQATSGLLYGFAISALQPGLNYPGTHPRTGANALSATIIGEHLDGTTVSTTNCTVETNLDGSISKVNWDLSNAQSLGYGKTTTTASSTTGGTGSSGTWTGLSVNGGGGLKRASLVISDDELTVGGTPSRNGDHDGQGFKKAEIIPLLAPQNGFGWSPLTDLPSYYAGISSNFAGEVGNNASAGSQQGDPQFIAESLVDVKFREVSLLRDRLDDMVIKDPSGDDQEDDSPWTDNTITKEEALNCLQFFVVSAGDLASIQPGAAAANNFSGAYIQQVGGGSNQLARAWLDQVSIIETLELNADGTFGQFRIYFHQNSNRRINEKIFPSTGQITLHQPNGTQIGNAITYSEIRGGEYVQGTGDVLFMEKRNPITRNDQQTEEIRLIIQF